MTQNQQKAEVARIADAIRQYLNEHPRAADTFEGVVHWWLLRQRYETAMTLVGEALDMLIQEGVLDVEKRQGSATIYKLRKQPETH